MRRGTFTAVLAWLALAASAQAHRLAPLSEKTAASIAAKYAEREGHRIFRVADLRATVLCGLFARYKAICSMTLGLRSTDELIWA